jgi:hypothetical protein
MCEPKGFGPLFGLACGQQSPLVGFLGAFSLLLSFGEQKKVHNMTDPASAGELDAVKVK